MQPSQLRNVAIIAHVDHGKTTLVDHLLKQAGVFRENQQVEERFMDSMDLEKERGITIQAKNACLFYKDVKINIVDTPGHSDFGGEVERILDMVDGAILLVDASEGPLPQTRFVLRKALEQKLKVLVCINKIDRPDSRVGEVLNEIFDLFIELEANDEQADFDVIYTVGRQGLAMKDPADLAQAKDLSLLLDYMVDKFPPPKAEPDGDFQLMVSNIDYNDYVGRLAVGRIRAGRIKVGQDMIAMQASDRVVPFRVTALYNFQASSHQQVQEAYAGDVVVIAGLNEINIGDTICLKDKPRPLPRLRVEEPTVAMMFSVNDGPFAGREGKMVTSRQIRSRLERELLRNVALKIEFPESDGQFKVVGRGELQLCILVEQMRREGFELVVSKPQVVLKTEGGVRMEPMEKVVVDVDEQFSGIVTRKMGERKGVMTLMDNKQSGRARIEYLVPARGLIGYRSEFLTDTRGTGLFNTQFAGWEPYKGDIKERTTGALVADRQGVATAYAIFHLEDRGRFFIQPGAEVYVGMVLGEHAKDNDLIVNICREKKLTNVRASGSDEAIRLTPVQPLVLEKCIEWINDEELIEVTPKNIRLRCRELDPHKRKSKASTES